MKSQKQRSSFILRLMVLGFSIAVGILSFWLLGYIISDIDRVQGPNYTQMLEEKLPQELQEERRVLTGQLEDLKQQIKMVEERRRLTSQTTSDSQQTINQLLQLKRNADQNKTSLSEDQQDALTDSLETFLAHQKNAQALNAELSQLNEDRNDVQAKQRVNESAIEVASEPIETEYQRRYAQHQWRLAAYKLGILIPLLMVCGWVFVRQAGGTYAMLVYAISGAVAMRVLLVMHEHFPAIYFKYILIVLSLAIATGVLVRLLRLVAKPSRDWLLRQYREAYSHFFCPICDYPIQRGPLKFASWTRRSLKKHTPIPVDGPVASFDHPYTCPCCETSLFETCEKCGGVRHSLLPACEKCGDVQRRSTNANEIGSRTKTT
ncbi:membrane protein [Rhodopirellula sallentina]|nr:membrane protein [Rhodopirellula sallentina]